MGRRGARARRVPRRGRRRGRRRRDARHRVGGPRAAAADSASGAVDCRLAQARCQRALGLAYADAARSFGAAEVATSDEGIAAGRHLDAACATLLELGDQALAARAYLDRASLHDDAAVAEGGGGRVEFVLEAEASHLDKLGEYLHAAHACAERCVFLASPRSLPPTVSLPAARELSAIKAELSRLHLRLADLNDRVKAANPPEEPQFPLVEGGDRDAVRAFVAPPVVAPPPPMLEAEGRAQLLAASALALAGGGARARARCARRRALCARGERRVGAGRPRAVEPPPPPPPPAPPAEGRAEEAAPAPAPESKDDADAAEAAAAAFAAAAPPPGAEDAAAAASALKEAITLSLSEGDLATAEASAILLANAAGVRASEEAAQWLCLYQACAAHRHWRAAWPGACAPSSARRCSRGSRCGCASAG